MTSLFDELLKQDSRVTEHLLRRGGLTHEEVEKQRKALPDDTGNAMYLPAYEEPAAESSGETPTFEAV